MIFELLGIQFSNLVKQTGRISLWYYTEFDLVNDDVFKQ